MVKSDFVVLIFMEGLDHGKILQWVEGAKVFPIPWEVQGRGITPFYTAGYGTVFQKYFATTKGKLSEAQ